MAKHGRKGRKRSMSGYIKGNVNETLGLGTLAGTTLIAANFDESPQETALISTLVATWALDNLTIGQGPIEFGVAHSDYTDAEIEQVLETTGSWDSGDKISKEIGNRLVRKIGVFVSDGASTDVKFNNGKPVKTKLNWRLNTNETLQLWAYNITGAALSTTTPSVHCDGHANLWQR